ncbi:hypothetical protein ZIOFF_019985 [Zingiber officinale]|uniref:Protein kinase domain-containing protein n=1 Tax=Zingiber officinale TaxID=94328 RepID=A0A8J5H7Q3_ZINOF|nr:hypothetical protein ZIOFF_019985 [Zingiber officinale]
MSGAAVSLPLHVLVLCLLVLFLVPSRGDSSCPNSESAPCGNASISYPFWLSNDANQTSPYCGYHGFMLTCQSGIPILSLGDHNYRVLQINYTGTVVSLADDDVFSPAQESCPRLRQNVTLPSNVALSYAHTYNNLTFFFNCSNSDSKWSSNMIPCFQFNRSGTDIMRSYVFLGIPNEFDSSTDCSEVVIWPAMESHVGNQLVEGYAAVLCEGFELHWTGDINANCSHCKNSGVRRKKHALKIGVAIGKEPHEKNEQDIEDFILQYESTIPKRYTYSEIKRMTKSFSDKLGNGGYGSVFKGSLEDGRSVAVKIPSGSEGNGKEFMNEVASISRTSHVNIVGLLGFCLEGSKKVLVYEFMPNGSLEKYIFDDKPNTENNKLSWAQLYDIVLGIARGLDYLHRGCNTRIVHFDIKPHNILLDQDFSPKISDFGLAKMCIQKDSIISTMTVRGTPGYIAPEVSCRSVGAISSKSDVYSYGMLVLEMVRGRNNFNVSSDHTSEIHFPHWIYDNLDNYCNLTVPEVNSETEEMVRKMIVVGLWCIQIKPENRPSISLVVDMLEGGISVLQMPPKPEFS